MQTPEEFEWSLYQSMDHQMDDWEDQGEVHDLIRARDAEVRAETLARVNAIAQQSTLSATDVRVVVEHIERVAGLAYESCGTNRLGQPTRRLVGPVEVEP